MFWFLDPCDVFVVVVVIVVEVGLDVTAAEFVDELDDGTTLDVLELVVDVAVAV